MIKLSCILSRRKIKHRPSWHLVFEWEDEIAHSLSLPIRAPWYIGWGLRSLARKCSVKCPVKGAPMLDFVMIAKADNGGRYGHRSVPWIIDWYLPASDVPRFLQSTAQCPYVLISSREAYEFLISNGADPKRYMHLPLSLPDRYRLNPDKPMVKDIDLALVGRITSSLLEYAKRYVAEHPGLNVVVKGPKRNHRPWVYDLDGNPVADIHTREDYIALMRRCRIFLYSTAGIDDSNTGTHGFSQVTPRFLEALACGCRPIMRYPDNADTRYYNLSEFGPSIDSYEQFEAEADRILSTPLDLNILASYLAPHYTSAVIKDTLIKE